MTNLIADPFFSGEAVVPITKRETQAQALAKLRAAINAGDFELAQRLARAP